MQSAALPTPTPPFKIFPSSVCLSPYGLPGSLLTCSNPKSLYPCYSLCLDSLLTGVHRSSLPGCQAFVQVPSWWSPLHSLIFQHHSASSSSLFPLSTSLQSTYLLINHTICSVSVSFHQNLSSKRTARFICFNHCYTLSTSKNSKAHSEVFNKYLLNEWMNTRKYSRLQEMEWDWE